MKIEVGQTWEGRGTYKGARFVVLKVEPETDDFAGRVSIRIDEISDAQRAESKAILEYAHASASSKRSAQNMLSGAPSFTEREMEWFRQWARLKLIAPVEGTL